MAGRPRGSGGVTTAPGVSGRGDPAGDAGPRCSDRLPHAAPGLSQRLPACSANWAALCAAAMRHARRPPSPSPGRARPGRSRLTGLVTALPWRIDPAGSPTAGALRSSAGRPPDALGTPRFGPPLERRVASAVAAALRAVLRTPPWIASPAAVRPVGASPRPARRAGLRPGRQPAPPLTDRRSPLSGRARTRPADWLWPPADLPGRRTLRPSGPADAGPPAPGACAGSAPGHRLEALARRPRSRADRTWPRTDPRPADPDPG